MRPESPCRARLCVDLGRPALRPRIWGGDLTGPQFPPAPTGPEPMRATSCPSRNNATNAGLSNSTRRSDLRLGVAESAGRDRGEGCWLPRGCTRPCLPLDGAGRSRGRSDSAWNDAKSQKGCGCAANAATAVPRLDQQPLRLHLARPLVDHSPDPTRRWTSTQAVSRTPHAGGYPHARLPYAACAPAQPARATNADRLRPRNGVHRRVDRCRRTPGNPGSVAIRG